MLRRQFRLFLLSAAALGAAWLGSHQVMAAEDPGSLPYAKIEEVFTRGDALDRSKLRMYVSVASRQSGISPKQITLTIQSKSGNVAIPINAAGELGNFPRTPALRAENPTVVTNQPKGTLALTVAIGLVPPEANAVPAARLTSVLAELNKFIKAQTGLMSFVVPKLQNVIFEFPAATKATVTISGAGAERVLKADETGHVPIKDLADLSRANAQFTFSERPNRITPER